MNEAEMKQAFRKYSVGIMAATFLAHFLQPIMVNDTMNVYYIYLPDSMDGPVHRSHSA